MTDFLIGRQQILDRQLNTFAYEILFRGTDFDLNLKDGAANATKQVISDTLLEIGLNDLVGPHKAFINFTTQNILDKVPLHLPKDRIVVEVLESVAVDAEIVANLRELSQLGYTLALDDFVLAPEWLPLLEFADIIKIDVMADTLEATRTLIDQLRPYNLTLLAEKSKPTASSKPCAIGVASYSRVFLQQTQSGGRQTPRRQPDRNLAIAGHGQ